MYIIAKNAVAGHWGVLLTVSNDHWYRFRVRVSPEEGKYNVRLYDMGSLLRFMSLMRLEHAQKLLADTDIPVCRVAECCGVKSANYFMRQFKARTGMTMLQCRRRKSSLPKPGAKARK